MTRSTSRSRLDEQAAAEAPLADDPARDPWYRRAGRGAAAGFVGTVLMSAVQWPAAIAAAEDPPPVEITERLQRYSGRRTRRGTVLMRATALHLAFGTAAGALYGVLSPRRAREVTGIGFAGMIWAVSYLGWLPILRLHPPAHRDEPRRQVGNAAAHALYGLSLAEAMRITEQRPRSSRGRRVDGRSASSRS